MEIIGLYILISSMIASIPFWFIGICFAVMLERLNLKNNNYEIK